VRRADLAAVVLAAGEGRRLRPLTTLRPKALCPVDNVPLLDGALDRVGHHSDHVAVNAHHLAEQVRAHLRGRPAVHLSVEDPVALGTAGAIGHLRGWLGGRHVLVHNADAWMTDSLDTLLDGWSGRVPRLLVTPAEERRADFADRRFVGVSLLPAHLAQSLAPTPSGLYETVWATEWASGRLELVDVAGPVFDCGTPQDYLAANLTASGGVSVVGAGAVVDGRLTRSVVWPGAKVAAGEHLVDVVRAGTDVTVDAAAATPPGR
jgi:NDP-sugar pyrophosphorylase family protein